VKRPASILALTLGLASAAAAQEPRGVPRTLLDRMLQERHVLLSGLEGGHISYSEGGLVRTEPVAEYLAILPAPARPAARASAPAATPRMRRPREARGVVLQLVDGQRFTGGFAREASETESVAWLNADLGSLEFRIDDVSSLRSAGGLAELPRSEVSDTVLLLNGDRLDGIVERLGDPVVISVGEAEHRLPLERIAAVSLANPPAPAHGTYVWLSDGTVVATRAVHTTRMGEVQLSPRITPESESSRPRGASLPLERIEAVNFDVRQLIPLATITPLDQQATGQRRLTRVARAVDEQPSPLDAADVLLPGPMEVVWSLPDGAVRLAMAAELPRESWTWGDCELIVEVRDSGGAATQLARHRLNAERPLGLVNAELPGESGSMLVVRLEPGEYGPIQDRVILRRPLLIAAPR
jgi:hypothetical protein